MIKDSYIFELANIGKRERNIENAMLERKRMYCLN